MPIYEYICEDCNDRFSLLRSIFEADKETKCPRCDSTKVAKAISSFACSTKSTPSNHACGGGG